MPGCLVPDKNRQKLRLIRTEFEFFTPALVDGFDWQQVSLSRQDSSQDSNRS